MCDELEFAGIHAFPFSPRPGTIGFSMKGKVNERVARERVAILNGIAKRNYEKYLESFEGCILFAVAEMSEGHLFVTTENYLQLPLKKRIEHQGGDCLLVRIAGNMAWEVCDKCDYFCLA